MQKSFINRKFITDKILSRLSGGKLSGGKRRGRWTVVGALCGFCCGMLLMIPSGCSDSRKLDRTLDAIEVEVEQAPQKALKSLDSIPQSALVTPEGKARYYLLTARARHRCYIDETDDSLISIAVEFYNLNPSVSPNGVSRKVLALYQQGIIRENDRNYLLALNSFLKAEAEAIPLREHYFLGYIYRHLCLLYENINAGKESVYYGKKSYKEFLATDSDPNVAYAMSELAYAYSVYCQYDSALIWADKCLELPYTLTDDHLRAEALRNAGKAATKLERPADAVEYFTRILREGKGEFKHEDAWNLSRAYQAIGASDKAFDICLKYPGADSTLADVPYEVLYARGDMEGAFNAIRNQLEREAMQTKDYARQDLTRALAEFREQEVRNEINRNKRGHVVWILGSCLFVALMVIIIMAMSRKFKRSRKELMSLMTTMETLNEELRSQIHAKDSIISEKETEKASARQSYYTLLESQIQQIDEMTSLFREPTSTTENRRLLKRINRLKENFCDPKFLEKMEQEINRFHGDIIRHLRREFPGMKEDDVRLFLYQVCGFSGRTITFLTGEELKSLYPRRSRLKSRILRSEAPSRADFLRYFS